VAGLPIHLDGARVWHAVAALQIPLAEYLEVVDTATLCLSKGLGAPVGSVLVGSASFVRQARRLRKALGGGMRQAGVLAAAGLVALDDFLVDNGSLLRVNHMRRGMLACYLLRQWHILNGGVELRMRPCQPPLGSGVVSTNLLFLEVSEGEDTVEMANILETHYGVRVCVWDEKRIRVAIHRDVSAEDLLRVADALEEVSVTRRTV
jgi:threonine aldolase